MKNKLIYKVLGIIAATMMAGFAAMGALTIWIEYRSTMELQTSNSRTLSAIVAKSISDSMMKGDTKEIDSYIREMKEKSFVRDLKIFTLEGKEANAASPAINAFVVSALSAGKAIEKKAVNHGTHSLVAAIPLPNEERCRKCHDAGPKYLGAILLDTSMEEGYASARKLTLLLSAAGFFFFFAILAAMYVFFKRTIVKDILECARMVEVLAEGGGDLTAELPVRSSDEIGQLSKGINDLIGKLRSVIADLYQQAEHVAVSVCTIKQENSGAVAAAAYQKSQSASVAVAAEEMAATLNDVASNTQNAAQLSSQVDGAAGTGMAAVGDTFYCMEVISGSVEETLGTVERLTGATDRIGEIITLIEDVADQTNLLALNAAIEAARAGDAGRGFAVVADEVKSLSAKTASSTKEIAAIIRSIQEEGRAAMASMTVEKERVGEGVSKAVAARASLTNILQLAGEATDMINQIACATEEQSATTDEISTKIHQMSEAASVVFQKMEANDATFHNLAEVAENIYTTVGKFSVGNYHDEMKRHAMELRDLVAAALESAIASGRITGNDLFERSYKPVPNTDPQKFTTAFDRLFDQIVSPLQEQILAKDSRMAFAICVDDHGYVPSHNLRYAQPLTGNPETDKVHNRTKRIFDDRTGGRAARNREPFLLQTYMRDTGEIMNDISTPVMIGNRHWGAIRVGYQVST